MYSEQDIDAVTELSFLLQDRVAYHSRFPGTTSASVSRVPGLRFPRWKIRLARHGDGDGEVAGSTPTSFPFLVITLAASCSHATASDA